MITKTVIIIAALVAMSLSIIYQSPILSVDFGGIANTIVIQKIE